MVSLLSKTDSISTGWIFKIAGCAFITLAIVTTATSCGLKDTVKAPNEIYQGSIQKAEQAPKPGDVKMVNGAEYIYARNRRFMTTSNEPEYVWIRKDQNSPGLFESIAKSNVQSEKEYQDLKKRIERLEVELNKAGN
jgi:hypothetical protein